LGEYTTMVCSKANYVNSAYEANKSSTIFTGWDKVGYVSTVGLQVALRDPI